MPLVIAFRLFASLLFILLPAAASAQQADVLKAEDAFRFSVERGQGEEIVLRWKIADGYYLYRDHIQARDTATGLDISLQTPPAVVESNDANFGASEVYYSQATARFKSGTSDQIAIIYQGCKKDSICYPPLTVTLDPRSLQVSKAVVGFRVAPTQEEPAKKTRSGDFHLAGDSLGGGMVGSLLASGGALWAVASFLAFGLLLAFTPCVLPMYPILSATLVREGEALTPQRGFVLSSAYVMAMALAFGMLGIVAAWSGQNLQMVLQSSYAIGAVAVLS